MRSTPTFTGVSEIELTYKTKVSTSLRPMISQSKDAYEIFREHWNADTIELQEQFKVMMINIAHKVIGIYECSTGGTTGTIADPRLIFTSALLANAKTIIVCHNHPSGSLKPSEADKKLTSRLKQAGQLLEIPVADHLIISTEGYLSFADEGLL